MIAPAVVVEVTAVGVPGALSVLVSTCESGPVIGEAKYAATRRSTVTVT